MAPSRAVRRAKHCHFLFTALFALVSMAVFLLPFIFINYVSTFQFSAVATVHLITGALAVALVFYAVLGRLVFTAKRDKAAPEFGGETGAQKFYDRALMALYSGMAVIVTCAVILTLVAVGIQLYNLLVILLVKCPDLPPLPFNNTNCTHHHQLPGPITIAEGLIGQKSAGTVRASSAADNHLYYEVMIRTICLNEYGFVIFLITFLFVIAVLCFALLGWFLHVRRHYDY